MDPKDLKSKLAAAEKHPQQIALAVAGLSGHVLKFRDNPKKWCIQEILAHLADMEVLYAHRMRQTLADKDPVISPIDQDDWAANLGYMETPPAESVAQFGLMRRSNIMLLRRINPASLQKTIFHPELNRKMTLAEWVERLVVHGPNHLQQIERLKQAAAKR
jgi:hypothetical protein